MLKVAQDRGIEVPEVKVPEPPKNEKAAEVELPEPPKDEKDDEKEDDKEDEENEDEKKKDATDGNAQEVVNIKSNQSLYGPLSDMNSPHRNPYSSTSKTPSSPLRPLPFELSAPCRLILTLRGPLASLPFPPQGAQSEERRRERGAEERSVLHHQLTTRDKTANKARYTPQSRERVATARNYVGRLEIADY